MYTLDYQQFQAQKTVISQKMIQSAEILQMDLQELQAYIQNQALENPMIDLDRTEHALSASAPDRSGHDSIQDIEFRRKLEWLNQSDEQNRIYYANECEENENKDFRNVAESENSLEEYVLSQLVTDLKTPKDEACINFLVYNLDSRGYLTDSEEELQSALGLSADELHNYKKLLQSADPAGAGASSLKECLQIQIRRRCKNGALSRADADLLTDLTEHWIEEIGKNHLNQIAKHMQISPAEVQRLCAILQTLNPIPANSFSSREKLKYIKPDVTVVHFSDYLEVLIGTEQTPHIFPSKYYLNLMKQDESEQVREYLEKKYQQVEWLQRCVQERAETLKLVSKEIVRAQETFFLKADGHRVPLNLQDVATRLGIHESTVSRAVKGKFLQCTKGVYPLNYFFTRQVGKPLEKPEKAERKSDQDKPLPLNSEETESSGITSEQIKSAILNLIDQENPAKPLSDQKLSNALNSLHITVARRTVAKYRQELEIPDASGRKQNR